MKIIFLGIGIFTTLILLDSCFIQKIKSKETLMEIIKEIINVNLFLLFMIFLTAMFIIVGFEFAIKKSANVSEFMGTVSSTFGPIFTGLITIWVLRKTIQKNEELQNKLVKIEEDRGLKESRTIFELFFIEDSFDFKDYSGRLSPGVFLSTESWNSLNIKTDDKLVIAPKKLNELKILLGYEKYTYGVIKNIGKNPMCDVKIKFNGVYDYNNKNRFESCIEYEQQYIDAGFSLVYPFFYINEEAQIYSFIPRTAEIEYSTALFGLREVVTTKLYFNVEENTVTREEEFSIKNDEALKKVFINQPSFIITEKGLK